MRMLPQMSQFPKKNVLTPIGALSIAIFGSCVAGAVMLGNTSLAWVLIGIGIIPVGVSLWAYIHFALTDPDRLQTEDYRIQRYYLSKMPKGLKYSDLQIPSDDSPVSRRLMGDTDNG